MRSPKRTHRRFIAAVATTLALGALPPGSVPAGAGAAAASAPVELISVASGGAQANGPSGLPGSSSIAVEGGLVLFTSSATNLGGQAPGLYVRDLAGDATHFLALSGGGGIEAGAVISDDGTVAVFNSETCGGLCFVRLGAGGVPESAPVALLDEEGNTFYAPHPAISGDGQRIVFHAPRDFSVTTADVITFDGVGNVFYTTPGSNEYAYVHKFADPDGDPGTRDCNINDAPEVSSDGRYVAFIGPADLEKFRVCGDEAVYVKDLQTGSLTKESVVGTDPSINNRPFGFDLSRDGRTLAFATNFDLRLQVFVRDLETQTTTLASVDGSDQPMDGTNHSPSLDQDGSLVAFFNTSLSDIYVRDLEKATTTRLTSGNDASTSPELSPDGMKVAFTSSATNLVVDDTNEVADVFLMDLSGAVVVNSVGIVADADPSDGRCDTGGKVSGEPECTLRAAIQEANAEPDKTEITFDIAGEAPFVIKEFGDLPPVSRAVVIDGTSQPGYDGEPLVVLRNRTDLSGGLPRFDRCSSHTGNGLVLEANNSVIRGLRVGGFPCGLWIKGGRNNTLEANQIGTSFSLSNLNAGIQITGGSGNVIGGSSADARNVVSANGAFGIAIYDSKDNLIQGNLIGTDKDGVTGSGNFVGIGVVNSSNNLIGGSRDDLSGCAAPCNLISGNRITGIRIEGNPQQGRSSNSVQGNVLGLNLAGTAAIPNQLSPFEETAALTIARSAGNFIGGTAPGVGNVIAGNDGHGIILFGKAASEAEGNELRGNWIGTDPSGAAFGNRLSGISISGWAEKTIVGGTSGVVQSRECLAPCNLIANNGTNGIEYSSNRGDFNESLLQGNLIRANAQSAPADRIHFYAGIRIGGSRQVTVGGGEEASGNLITENRGHGIAVIASTDFVHILGNSIVDNGALGITRGWKKDPLPVDPDSAGQQPGIGLQNAPLLESVETSLGGTTLTGTLYSKQGTYRIDFFAGVDCDPSGAGEGDLGLGSTTVTVDSSGKAAFSAELSGTADFNPSYTATATREPDGADPTTSEFSRCIPAFPRTTLNSAAPAGSSTLDVEDDSGFDKGDRIEINPGGSNEEQATVTAKGSLILEEPLGFDHAADEDVVKIDDGDLELEDSRLSVRASLRKKIVVRGSLAPPYPGGSVTVRLERRARNGWKKVAKRAAVLGDVVEAGSRLVSKYRLKLGRVSGTRCRVTVSWDGAGLLTPAKERTRAFRC